jgi:O-antigen/teichoic acid export membrane protein
MNSFVSRYRKSTLARNTGWMFLGQGLRLVIQAGYFIIIARSLGVQQYGAFAAVTAMVAIFSPFVGLGSGNLIIQNVARNVELLEECFGNGVLMTLVTGVAGVGIVIGICRWVLPASIAMTIILMVALADLVCCRLIFMVASAFLAVERLDKTAQLNVLISAARFIGIAVTVAVVRHPTAELWSIVYAATTGVATVISLLCVRALVRSFKMAPDRIKVELLEGLYFSGGISAQTIYNDVDKTMLARLSTLDANGIYSAAYRLIDVAFIPVSSVIYAAYTGYFRFGEGKIQATYEYAKRLLPRPIGYSLLAFAGLLVGAPLIPKILGAEYLRTVEALRWLAILPLLKTAHYFFADALSGAGYQGLRMCLQIVVAVFNVLVNLWLIPAYSWRGAAWSSLASDGLLALLMWIAITTLRHRQLATVTTPAPVVALHRRSDEEGEYLSTR